LGPSVYRQRLCNLPSPPPPPPLPPPLPPSPHLSTSLAPTTTTTTPSPLSPSVHLPCVLRPTVPFPRPCCVPQSKSRSRTRRLRRQGRPWLQRRWGTYTLGCSWLLGGPWPELHRCSCIHLVGILVRCPSSLPPPRRPYPGGDHCPATVPGRRVCVPSHGDRHGHRGPGRGGGPAARGGDPAGNHRC
jgi:hypothetical protein